MKSMLFPWIAAGVLCLVASPVCLSAAETDARAVVQSLEDSIDELMNVNNGPDVFMYWQRMKRSATQLSNYSTDRSIPEDYEQSVKGLSEALRRVVQDSGLSLREKTRICAAVERDLEIKVEFANRKPSAPFGNIMLAAKTTDGDKEISGCEVWYVPLAWEDTKGRYSRFSKLSSPTSKELPPGFYSMWTCKGGHEGRRTPVTVERGSAKQDVHLPAPAVG